MAKSSTTDQTLPNAGDLLPPKRYIYCMADLEKFHLSSVRRDLLSFANVLGRSCISCGPFNPDKPLADLSPAMAALRGALVGMEKWVEEIPPDKDAKARFGNPLFRKWHERLVERTNIVIGTILDVHAKAQGNEIDEESRRSFIEDAHRLGLEAVRGDENSSTFVPKMSSASVKQRDDICVECAAYWHASFGHPTRLDYGTGHEASFLVFLYALYRAGCFEPKPKVLRAVTLSIFSQYLKVCRGLQTIYMLEPAGSHGVWGLDDYHCLPFYFGACQLINNFEGFEPRSIHDQRILEEYHHRYLYFGCIRYIMVSIFGDAFTKVLIIPSNLFRM